MALRRNRTRKTLPWFGPRLKRWEEQILRKEGYEPRYHDCPKWPDINYPPPSIVGTNNATVALRFINDTSVVTIHHGELWEFSTDGDIITYEVASERGRVYCI